MTMPALPPGFQEAVNALNAVAQTINDVQAAHAAGTGPALALDTVIAYAQAQATVALASAAATLVAGAQQRRILVP